jgi:hypothetical protein
MQKTIIAFVTGIAVGAITVGGSAVASQSSAPAKSGISAIEMRLFTIDKGRLDEFSAAWHATVYPERINMGFRIPFAAKIPATNQFVWLVEYTGPESLDAKEAVYYASPERKKRSPDPSQWIARNERLKLTPILDPFH